MSAQLKSLLEDAFADDIAHSMVDVADILVVDDLPEKLMVYEAILGDLGQNIVMARSGEEALRLILKQEFAVILLDVNMPGFDGFETASLIRQRKKSSHTPIIFLTAFTDEIRMAQGYASGAVDYLPTPVVPEILRAKVRVFIELSQMRRRAALQAKEHALRTAAEEAGRRASFLASASEKFSRARNSGEIIELLATLPIPSLGELAIIGVSNTEKKTDEIIRARVDSGSVKAAPMTDKEAETRDLRDAFAAVVRNGKPTTSFHASSLMGSELYSSNVILPFTMRGGIQGCLLVAREVQREPFSHADILFASDLVARAIIALENILLMEQIKEADQRKDEFLATLAHELRNPLAPIHNALQIIRSSSNETRRKESEETIERQLKHMVRLVDDLMDVSRITRGKIELRKEPLILSAALQQAIEATQPLMTKKEHVLTVNLPAEPLWLNADMERLAQVFSNLLNNAAKYSQPKSHIDLSVSHSNDRVMIAIKDNGIGIEGAMLGRIFDVFLQVDNSLGRSEGGLGIGLTLVRRLVEKHDGTVVAKSMGLEQGSEFIVSLPLIQPPVNTNPEEKLEAPVEQTKGKMRVLVVDDNEASAKTLGWMMEAMGHDTYLAHDSKMALEIAEKVLPQVVLMDIGLPGMNGYELCKLMHENDAYKKSVFIAQTGWGQPEHRRRSKEAGFDHHLVKPIMMDSLENLLNEIMISKAV